MCSGRIQFVWPLSHRMTTMRPCSRNSAVVRGKRPFIAPDAAVNRRGTQAATGWAHPWPAATSGGSRGHLSRCRYPHFDYAETVTGTLGRSRARPGTRTPRCRRGWRRHSSAPPASSRRRSYLGRNGPAKVWRREKTLQRSPRRSIGQIRCSGASHDHAAGGMPNASVHPRKAIGALEAAA